MQEEDAFPLPAFGFKGLEYNKVQDVLPLSSFLLWFFACSFLPFLMWNKEIHSVF